MKNMFKILVAVILAGSVLSVNAQDVKVLSTFNKSLTNVTGATVFVPEGAGFAHVTDLTAVDGVKGGFVRIYPGKAAIAQTLTNTTTTIYVPNTNAFAVGDVLVFSKTGGHELRTVATLGAATNITVNAAPTTAQKTGQVFWLLDTPSDRYLVSGLTGETGNSLTNSFVPSVCDIWLPAEFPSAIQATNASGTAIKIRISGKRVR